VDGYSTELRQHSHHDEMAHLKVRAIEKLKVPSNLIADTAQYVSRQAAY
jgi:hypothetical protein